MNNRLLMTPGPTTIRENVRQAMAKAITNPDLDMDFYEFYKDICDKFQKLLSTKNRIRILSGEGILGLEAACASLIETGDKVLCIENGIFGEGFGDFAKIYGGEVDYIHCDRRKGLNYNEIEAYLKNNHDYKVATLVHCETPSGMTNDIKEICKLLSSYNILTVVDAVASIGGEEVLVDEWCIDIALGGSQKCLSAAPGLTFMSVSDKAIVAMKNRKESIKGFYSNLLIWENWYENKWFPYTQPISELYGLDQALDNILSEENVIERHRKNAEGCRKALVEAGLELFPQDSYSNTVTTVVIPEGITFNAIFDEMVKEHGVMIAGAFDFLKDKVIRIGHMGENSKEENLYITLKALNSVLKELGVELKDNIHEIYAKE